MSFEFKKELDILFGDLVLEDIIWSIAIIMAIIAFPLAFLY